LIWTVVGCTSTTTPSDSQQRAPVQNGGGSSSSKTKDDLRPTKLENCVTAVGAVLEVVMFEVADLTAIAAIALKPAL